MSRDQFATTAMKNKLIIKVYVLCVVIILALADKCQTPNGEKAECIPLRSCPILMKALITLKPDYLRFIIKSQCGFNKEALVCCGSSATYATSRTSVTTEKTMNTLEKLQDSKRYCGYQRFDDYFHESNDSAVTSIDEFPWLAGLIYEDPYDKDKFVFGCSGSLINNRYVITAAHCIANTQHLKLIKVRLGEYNTKQKEDCIRNGRFDDECADPIVDYEIEEMTIHPQYQIRTHEFDIALIRLKTVVTYSDFVRPICLPLPGTKLAKIGDILHETGWKSPSLNFEQGFVKKKIVVELLSIERCKKAYEQVPRINITEINYSCTSETLASKDSVCAGDSGGPLMNANRHQWYLEGVITFGIECDHNVPSINTKVAIYLDWIVRTMRA